MAHRISKQDLEKVLERINDATGQALEGWIKNEAGTYCANVGTYVLDWCYGGVRLSQLTNEAGGERDITGRGTKRETYHAMHAFLAGIEAGNNVYETPQGRDEAHRINVRWYRRQGLSVPGLSDEDADALIRGES